MLGGGSCLGAGLKNVLLLSVEVCGMQSRRYLATCRRLRTRPGPDRDHPVSCSGGSLFGERRGRERRQGEEREMREERERRKTDRGEREEERKSERERGKRERGKKEREKRRKREREERDN
ncbi:hypothetical protein WMY93_031920 [Mugilogobius chulae]|uniref:Uncharacterized protein n=1 Tax=Mugilogobius chulae TaxID=88201 RepID=A0AAW0MDT0_9GOBI